MWKTVTVVLLSLLLSGFVFAEEAVVTISLVNEHGAIKEIGTVTASDGMFGLILAPKLTDLAPGLHGFHVHDKPDCSHSIKDGKAVNSQVQLFLYA